MTDQTRFFPDPGDPIPSPLNAAPIPARPNRRNLVLAGVAAGALLIGCCGGFTIAAVGQPEPKTITVSSPSPYPVTDYVAVVPSAPAPAPTSAAPAPATIEDGVWLVGVDVPTGTYRTVDVVTNCYWAVYKAGTNQDNIINNDIVDGGRPTVKLAKGQEFKTERCGTWIRTGK